MRRVFCSYLNLLVNTKNDLALALTLDVPSRALGRQAFTDVKHAAQNNNTSLFLVRCAQALNTLKPKSYDIKIRVNPLAWHIWVSFVFSQAVTSFVRAVQLGGKGYAPAESDPLRKHVKGLSDFVQFLDNLEEILGEIPDPRYTMQLNTSFHSLPVLLFSGCECWEAGLFSVQGRTVNSWCIPAELLN